MLLDKLNKKSDRFSQLSEIIQNIDLCNDIKGVLAVSLDRALKALSSGRGSIFLVSEDGQEMYLKLSYGLEPPLGEIKKKLGEGVVGMVAKERKPVLIKDIRKDSRFKPNGVFNNYKSNSFLCVPIISEDRLIGVISITEKASKKPYTKEELEFLTVLSEHIALKIEKGQLLSEKVRLERELDISRRFASLGKFAGNIAHELNNPLDGVMRFVNLAFDCVGENEVTREYLLEAKTGLSRMANVIRSLLELSRQKNVQQKPIDVNRCIENALLSLRFQAIYNSIEVIKNFAEGLPKLIDMGLEQVFANIFKNSLDAMPTGGKLTIESTQEEGFIKVAISDTGCGIQNDKIDSIFEPFFTTKDIDKGLGLGLTVCYEIVKQYNGRIEVESELGKGSTFKIYLPVTN